MLLSLRCGGTIPVDQKRIIQFLVKIKQMFAEKRCFPNDIYLIHRQIRRIGDQFIRLKRQIDPVAKFGLPPDLHVCTVCAAIPQCGTVVFIRHRFVCRDAGGYGPSADTVKPAYFQLVDTMPYSVNLIHLHSRMECAGDAKVQNSLDPVPKI